MSSESGGEWGVRSECVVDMLSAEAIVGVGVLKLNSRMLEPAELKRLDKQEKGQVTDVFGVAKGEGD